jgi:hypothetical protein
MTVSGCRLFDPLIASQCAKTLRSVFRLGGMLYVVAIAFDALVDDCVLGTVVETTAGLCLLAKRRSTEPTVEDHLTFVGTATTLFLEGIRFRGCYRTRSERSARHGVHRHRFDDSAGNIGACAPILHQLAARSKCSSRASG